MNDSIFQRCGNCKYVAFFPFPSPCPGCDKDSYNYVIEDVEISKTPEVAYDEDDDL